MTQMVGETGALAPDAFVVYWRQRQTQGRARSMRLSQHARRCGTDRCPAAA